MSEAVDRFLGYTIARMIKHNVKIILYPKLTTPDDCDGSFGSNYPDAPCEFEVATKKIKHEWLSVYVHEYGHFLQHIYKEPLYVNSDGPLNRTWDYIMKKRRTFKWADVRAVQAVERDCELRVVRLIKYHKLPLDISKYIREANCVLFYYNEATKRRRWWPNKGKLPFYAKGIKDIIPDTILPIEAYEVSPDGYSELCDEYCFKSLARKKIK